MNYPSIRIEGAILSPDMLDHLEDAPGQRPSDFGLDPSVRVKDEIVRAWADAQDYWRIFQRKLQNIRPDSPATTETRNQWVVPLFGLLGYQLEHQSRAVELNGKTYAISHRAANRASAPIHIVGYREPAGLDRKPEKAALRMSAHGMVQEYLNLRDELYGIVTNGRVLRYSELGRHKETTPSKNAEPFSPPRRSPHHDQPCVKALLIRSSDSSHTLNHTCLDDYCTAAFVEREARRPASPPKIVDRNSELLLLDSRT